MRGFMRHLRPFWEVHRHRASPETGAAINGLLKSGWFTVCAGRFDSARVVGDLAEVTVRTRGSGERKTFRVGAVLNCTGPATDVRVVLKYDPPAGKVGAAVAEWLGESPERQIENDLNEFKRLMEVGGPSETRNPPAAR